MATSSTAHHYTGPDKCIVYWDYENVPIPHKSILRTVIGVLKQRIWDRIGPKQIPIQFKLYIRATKLPHTLQDDMDINGVEHINISSRKPESVDKRMLVDIALHLYELEKYKRSDAIALISGDKDFGHLLSRMHKEPPISHSLLILLDPMQSINPNLSNNVDFVINDFNHCSFQICNRPNCENVSQNCAYYHPNNRYYPKNMPMRPQKHRNKNRKKRQRFHNGNRSHNKRRKIDAKLANFAWNTNANASTNNSNNAKKGNESDSSIEFLQTIKPTKITINIQQIGTDRKDTLKMNNNVKVSVIMNKICEMYSDIQIEALSLQFNGAKMQSNKSIDLYDVSEGDKLWWFVEEDCGNGMCSEQKSNAKDNTDNETKEMSKELAKGNPYFANESENEKNIKNGAPKLDLVQRGTEIDDRDSNGNDKEANKANDKARIIFDLT